MALKGIKVVEIMGLAPGPLCGTMLADYGATVTVISRIQPSPFNVMSNGKRMLAVDLKTKEGLTVMKKLCAASDVLLDTFRPGVMEHLGLGADQLLKENNRISMLSRMCVARSGFGTIHSLKTPVPQRFVPRNYVVRNYAREPRSRVAARPQHTIWERLMAPAGPNAFSLGKGALAGASAVGLGALCYYGTGVKPGTLQEAHLWPKYVKDRIKTTYAYIAGSLALTAGSAITVFRTPALLNLVARNGWISIIVTMGLMIGSGMVVRGMDYTPGFGPKQLAWIVHTGIMGAVIAPMCFLGGPVLVRAAWYTAGVVGGLSTIAICAPSGEFLNMRAPLAMGLGVVFAASLAGMFLPPTSALGAGLYSLSLYGGLIVFGGFLLYDTQAIIKRAEMHPPHGFQPYDPINSAISVYLDVLNIFMRIAMILAGGGGNKRK